VWLIDVRGGRMDRTLLGLDLNTPSASRIYDYFLGGSHNFEIDRAVAREIIALRPDVPALARRNRAFLRRSVRYMVEQGITQFIDIGSGIPTEGNVHEVARAANPAARVVYVDRDPVAVAHSRVILDRESRIAVLQTDLRNPHEIMDSPHVASLIDFTQPVGILMFAVLHFVLDDEDPADLVATFGDRIVSGSYLAISHATVDPDPQRAAVIEELYRSTPTPSALRTPGEVAALFGRFDLVEPGLVELSRWRPDVGSLPPAEAEAAYGGVARLP